jgi:hypothetical protein
MAPCDTTVGPTPTGLVERVLGIKLSLSPPGLCLTPCRFLDQRLTGINLRLLGRLRVGIGILVHDPPDDLLHHLGMTIECIPVANLSILAAARGLPLRPLSPVKTPRPMGIFLWVRRE